MKTIVADSLQRLYRDVLFTILNEGNEVKVRDLMTKEIHPCLMHIINPQKRTLLYPKRGNNPFATLAETMWVLAGRNDMKFLTMFLPRAADFSDDGQVWRAGYGPRLRKWDYVEYKHYPELIEDEHKITDQIQFIMKQLKKDKKIISNKNIHLISGPRSLKDLAKIANDSKFFVALDGGAEHYLERYTNSVTFYTCGFPVNWKPFSLNSYNLISTDSTQVLEESTTSAGIRKYGFYNLGKRKPCYDLVCDYQKFKELDFKEVAQLL